MKFVKKSQLNFRNVKDQSVSVETDGRVTMDGNLSLLLPKGTTAQQPGSPVDGMVRYNSQTGEFEGRQAGAWRSFRFKESTQITLQNLGTGDGSTVTFGPLNPIPPAVVQSGATWGGQNLIVIVGNVFQVFNTNYTITNPSAGVYNIQFNTAAPNGQAVSVLHGFDK